MPDLRLGDIIDDYCSRCRLLTNHAIVSLVNDEPAKVHCRSCFFEHSYQHGQGVEKKKGLGAQGEAVQRGSFFDHGQPPGNR